MPEAARVKLTLLGIPSLELRRDWFRDYLSRESSEGVAGVLDSLCEGGEQGDRDAKEALFAVVLLLVAEPELPPWAALRELALQERLLSLERLLRFEPPTPEERAPQGELPVPDYGAGRELTLGERRSMARRSPRARIDRLLSDPHPMVIQELLLNPCLTEDDIVRWAARRPAPVRALQALVRAPRWLKSERVRLALLFNPGVPASVSVPLTALASRQHLNELARSAQVPGALRAIAYERVERLPPLPATEAKLIH